MPHLPKTDPLAQKLAALIEKQRALGAIGTEQTELSAKVESYIRTGDPSDEAAMVKIAASRTRLEMLPHVAKRIEVEIEALATELHRQLDSFEAELVTLAIHERETLVDKLEAMLLPYAPPVRALNGETTNRARNVAASLPIVRLFPASSGDLPAPHVSLSQIPAQFAASVVSRATEVLSYHAAVSRAGSFVPEDFGK